MSGGFYKYRCKYFYTHNCQNWVWVNNAPCATCLAEGRDDEAFESSSTLTLCRDIVVPRIQDGILQYALMELISPIHSGEHWTVRDKAVPLPVIPATNVVPMIAGIGIAED